MDKKRTTVLSTEDAALLLVGTVARRLDVSDDRVRQLERTGVLRAIRTSTGVRLFDPADVERVRIERAEKRNK